MIDPYRCGDLVKFWNLLADGNHVTIVHAAREELNFALNACQRPPANLFDTQLAAGLPVPIASALIRSLFLRIRTGRSCV